MEKKKSNMEIEKKCKPAKLYSFLSLLYRDKRDVREKRGRAKSWVNEKLWS